MSNTTAAAFRVTTEDSHTSQTEPVTFGDLLLQTYNAALAHPTDLNRHRTDLLRHATDPNIAYSLYELFTDELANHGALTRNQDDDDPSDCIGCWMQLYINRGLLEPTDQQALATTMLNVAARALEFPIAPTEDEDQLFTRDPQAMIRAAYALARDMLGRGPGDYLAR